jgi:hypothetical protein
MLGMPKRSSKKKDLNELAYATVQKLTGQAPPEPPERPKNPAAVELGRLGGIKGGRARAEKLSPAKRKQIAKKAAAARWSKRNQTSGVSSSSPEP